MGAGRVLLGAIMMVSSLAVPARAGDPVVRTAPFDEGVEVENCSPGIGTCAMSTYADAATGRFGGWMYVAGDPGRGPAMRYAFLRATIVARFAFPSSVPRADVTVRVRVDEITLTAEKDLQPVEDATATDVRGFASLSLFSSGDFSECRCRGRYDGLRDSRDEYDAGVPAGTIIERSISVERGYANQTGPLDVSVSLTGVIDPGSWPVPGSGRYTASADLTLLSVEATPAQPPGDRVITANAPFARTHEYTACDEGLLVSRCEPAADADAATGVASAVSQVRPFAGEEGIAEGEAWAASSVAGAVTLPEPVESLAFSARFTVSGLERIVPFDMLARAGTDVWVSARRVGCACGSSIPSPVVGLADGTFTVTGTLLHGNAGAIPPGEIEISVRVSTFAHVYDGPAPVRATGTVTLEEIAIRY